MRHVLTLTLCLALLHLVACGSEESANLDLAASPSVLAEASYEYTATDAVAEPRQEAGLSRATSDSVDGTPLTATPIAAQQRKIIFNATVQLVVDDFEDVPKAVRELATTHGGFIASSSIQGSEGEPRHGDWTLRIPSAQFDAFLDGSKALGQVRSLNSDSKEVTAEYVDLESRARNLKAEEDRLHKHLNESTRSLREILEIEREIARVRGEVERIEGRLNVLKDLTTLSNVTLSIEESRDYVPEPTEEPGFATQVARTWDSSIGGVGSFLSRLSLAVVGLVPWLAVLVPLGVIGWLVQRAVRRHLPRAAVAPAVPEESAG